MLVALVMFIVWSIVELFVMVQVAGAIGVLPTVALVVAMSVAGLWLMKVEGLGVLRRAANQLDRGEVPTDEVVNGVLIVVGGLLMFIPGFVSGAIGLALLFPPVRAVVRPLVVARAQRRIDRGRTRFAVFSTGFPGRVYDVDSTLDERRPPDGRGSWPASPPELGS